MNIKLMIAGLLTLVTVALLAGACSLQGQSAAPAASGIEITDYLGKTVKLNEPPVRIISLAPSNTEILYALGLGDRVIGVTESDDYPSEVKSKPQVGSFSSPNIEQILKLTPDLVIASKTGEGTFLPQLEGMGIKVVSLDPKTIDEVLDSITLIGKLTGKEAEAGQLVADLAQRIKDITDQTLNLPEDSKPKVFYAVWHDPLMSGGTGTIHNELVMKAGGINIAGSLSGYASISLEAVVKENPDVMIAGTHGEEAPLTLNFLKNDARLTLTGARQSNRVYSINDEPVRRPSARIAEGLEMVARVIHPELFGKK